MAIQPSAAQTEDITASISQREQLWEQQMKILTENNETLQSTLAEKERRWEQERSELLQRAEESERKLQIQHRALTERCEVLMAALEIKYAEDKERNRDKGSGSDSAACERVNINVGGKVFATSIDTLQRNDFRYERWPLHADGERPVAAASTIMPIVTSLLLGQGATSLIAIRSTSPS